MEKHFRLLAIALLLALGVSATRAQTLFGPEAGDWELTLGGGGSNDRDFDTGSFALNTSLGYFFTPAMELSVRQGVGFSDFGDSVWNGSTRLAFDYHFDLNRFRPFVGVNFGGVYGETVRNTFAAGLETGLKYYVLEKTFLFGSVEYDWFFRSARRADNTFRHGQFLYVVGIGFNF
jgi:hypothetical protein